MVSVRGILVNNDDLGAFFVSENVLEGKNQIKYAFREDIGIPIANGWQIFGEGDEEFELVTIHTLKLIFPEIFELLAFDYGTKLEIIYCDGKYDTYKEVK